MARARRTRRMVAVRSTGGQSTLCLLSLPEGGRTRPDTQRGAFVRLVDVVKLVDARCADIVAKRWIGPPSRYSRLQCVARNRKRPAYCRLKLARPSHGRWRFWTPPPCRQSEGGGRRPTISNFTGIAALRRFGCWRAPLVRHSKARLVSLEHNSTSPKSKTMVHLLHGRPCHSLIAWVFSPCIRIFVPNSNIEIMSSAEDCQKHGNNKVADS